MKTENYSLGVQTFERLVDENRIYVDKTELICTLLDHSHHLILAAPLLPFLPCIARVCRDAGEYDAVARGTRFRSG